ncbi:MAG TPA: hypothetical protein VFU01_17195 [Gemmatimonadaceae bacterium]|nr:hypothetical protein [Gemmatimonadaceae bacterium]
MKHRGGVVSGIGAVSFAVLLACGPPQVTLTPLGAGVVYPATPDSVAIPLYATTKPECPYDEIAAITAEGHIAHSVESEVLAALRAKARAVGGHAIVGYTQSSRVATSGSLSTDIHVRSGTAIRFRSADCMK